MDYWKQCIFEAFEDSGITATDEQVDTVATWAEGAHDNYGMANGHDVIRDSVPSRFEMEREIQSQADRIKELESQVSIFKNSVARRRNVRPEDVYLEGNSVMYSN